MRNTEGQTEGSPIYSPQSLFVGGLIKLCWDNIFEGRGQSSHYPSFCKN